MQWCSFLLTFSVLASTVLALPTHYVSSWHNETHLSEPMQRRASTAIDLCGVPMRDTGAIYDVCKKTPIRFVMNDGKFQTVLQAGPNGAPVDGPAGTQCDHALELQILDNVLNENGACDAIQAILRAVPQKATAPPTAMMSLVEPLLKPLVDRINASPNGIFLDAKINGVKKQMITNIMKPPTTTTFAPTADQIKAVKTYYNNPTVAGSVEAVARDLDRLMAQMITNAVNKVTPALQAMPTGNARQQQAKTAVSNAINTARTQTFHSTQTVSAKLEAILASIAAYPIPN